MWKLVSVHLEIVLFLTQDRCTVCAKCTIGSVIVFGHTRWYSLVMRLKWKLFLIRLEIVLILTQDRCTVCAKRTIGSETILDVPNDTPRR
jgi:hypothetical protein